MVAIVFSSSFFTHGSRIYITHTNPNSWTPYVVSKIQEKIVFLKMTKNKIAVS